MKKAFNPKLNLLFMFITQTRKYSDSVPTIISNYSIPCI